MEDKSLFFLLRVFFLSPKQSNGVYKRLVYYDGWLLTHPDEDFSRMAINDEDLNTDIGPSMTSVSGDPPLQGGNVQVRGQEGSKGSPCMDGCNGGLLLGREGGREGSRGGGTVNFLWLLQI